MQSSLKKQIADKYPQIKAKETAPSIGPLSWYQTPAMIRIWMGLILGALFLLLSCPFIYTRTGALLERSVGGQWVSPSLSASLSCSLVFIHSLLFSFLAILVVYMHTC